MKKFEECISILKNIRDRISLDEYLKEPFYYSTGERNLHLVIESLLDISNFIIANYGFRQPETYSDIILILKDEKIIPPELADKVEKLPAFRNILVHEYLTLDRKLIFEKIKNSLSDLEEYMQCLVSFLKI
ncbi:DUF86 domain-containing protein [candidate division KSB1 bacterium]|nr:DUF86 domain-containing protein [candidate division KSB1 bacterium]